MKPSIKIYFFLSLLLFSFNSIQATTITWLGGNASWSDAAQWDTGTVPGFGDDVIIPSGYVRIYDGEDEYARSVEIQSAGRLSIYQDGLLELSGAKDNEALHNMGRVYVYGHLYINDVTRTSTNISANAIKNDRYFYTYANSQINIKYIEDIGILNGPSSYFRARGKLWIYETELGAISNRDNFYNSGLISIEDCGSPNSYAMANSDNFKNYSTGEIIISSDIYSTFDNTASVRNYGSITVEKSNVGFNNAGTITNYAGAILNTENCGIGYYNRSVGTISNSGAVKSFYAIEAINNYGTFNNYENVSLFYSSHNGGLRNLSTGVFHNFRSIYILGSGSRDVNNEGIINNYAGAILSVNKKIDIKPTGTLINDGFIVSYMATGSHIVAGVLENNGVIDDNYGNFPAAVDNQKVIVAPVTGPMYEGVPYPNVLDVSSLNGLTIRDWKVDKFLNSSIAGTYDAATNEFTPNSNAVGISTIYISIEDNASGFRRNFTLEVDEGILSSSGNNNFVQDNLDEITPNLKSESVDVFPNPTSGSIQLKSEIFEASPSSVEVFNTLGQLVQQEQLSQGGFTQRFDFSAQLTNGIYFVKLIQNGKEVNTKRIQLQR